MAEPEVEAAWGAEFKRIREEAFHSGSDDRLALSALACRFCIEAARNAKALGCPGPLISPLGRSGARQP